MGRERLLAETRFSTILAGAEPLSQATANEPLHPEPTANQREGNHAMSKPEAFNLWTWSRCQSAIRSLPGRLGFPKGDRLRVLDLEVNLKDGSVTDTTLNRPFDPREEYIFFLLSRYAEAKQVPPIGKLVSFRQIPGGRAYDPVFEGRVVAPVARHLGDKVDRFAKAAEHLGGRPVAQGDKAYVVNALPLVPLTYVLWKGDEEFPPRAQVLLDASAESYLDAEAITHLASITTSRLVAVGLSLKGG